MLNDLPFHVVGVSHHSAGVALRERLSFAAGEVVGLLDAESHLGRTLVLLSTCNRSELYWWGDHDVAPWFPARAGAVPIVRRDGAAAVRHLFRVAAGLDSQILGETEIMSQVRRAYDLARAAGSTNRDLDMLFSAALSAGRRVRRETLLDRHPLSVSGAAVQLAERETRGALAASRVLVLGAGEAADGVLRALHEARVPQVTIVNRDPVRARTLAATWGVTDIRSWNELPRSVAEADVVIAATAAASAILTADAIAAARGPRSRRELLLVDLCVPRNIEPDARALPGVRLFDLDDLQQRYCPADGAGLAALHEVERLLEAELARLGDALRGRAAALQLAALHRLGDRVAAEEAERALGELGVLSPEEQAVVRRMAERVVRRVLYPTSRAMRAGVAAPIPIP